MSEVKNKLTQKYNVTKADLAERYGVSTKTIENWCEAKQFPQPHRFSRKCVRWNMDDITAHERKIGYVANT